MVSIYSIGCRPKIFKASSFSDKAEIFSTIVSKCIFSLLCLKSRLFGKKAAAMRNFVAQLFGRYLTPALEDIWKAHLGITGFIDDAEMMELNFIWAFSFRFLSLSLSLSLLFLYWFLNIIINVWVVVEPVRVSTNWTSSKSRASTVTGRPRLSRLHEAK